MQPNIVQEIQVEKEGMFFKTRGVFPHLYRGREYLYSAFYMKYKEGVVANSYHNPKLVIQRNLRDDTFNMKISIDDPIEWQVHPRFQIDSEIITDPFKDIPTNERRHLNVMAHSSLLLNKKLLSVNNLAAGIDITDLNNITLEHRGPDIGGFMINIGNLQRNHNINARANKIIKLQTINSITIKKPSAIKEIYSDINKNGSKWNMLITTEDGDKHHYFDNKITTTLSYNNIFLVPHSISRYEHNLIAYDVYMNNEDGTDIIGDIGLKDGEMKTSATGSSKFRLGFHSTYDQNKTKTFGKDKATYIGYYQIESNSFYDYEHNKTVVGGSYDAARGDLVPYNLKGNYMRSLSFDVNVDYGKLHIDESTIYRDPVLDSSIGSVVLDINTSTFDEQIKMKKLNNLKVKEIRENIGEISLRDIRGDDNE